MKATLLLQSRYSPMRSRHIARTNISPSLRIGRQLNEVWAIAFSVDVLAWTTSTASDHERAARLLGGARELWRRVGWRHAGVPLLYGMRRLTQHYDRCLSQLSEQFDVDHLERVNEGRSSVRDDVR